MTKLTSPSEPQAETPQKLTEHRPRETLLYPFKVIVSPLKAFKEIAQNPDFKGIIMVLALLLLTSAGTQYVSASKIFLTIDGQSISLLASNMFGDYMFRSSIETGLVFFASWFVFAGVLYLIMRAFREKGMVWRPFLVLVGYVFSVFIIRMVVTAVLISTLPNLQLGISTWPPATREDYLVYVDQFNATWAPTLASQALSVIIWVVYGWFVLLSAVAVRSSKEIAFGKSIMISLTAYLIIFFLSSVLSLPVMI